MAVAGRDYRGKLIKQKKAKQLISVARRTTLDAHLICKARFSEADGNPKLCEYALSEIKQFEALPGDQYRPREQLRQVRWR